MSWRKSINSITIFLIGIFLGANLTQFHALHNTGMTNNKQTDPSLSTETGVPSRRRKNKASRIISGEPTLLHQALEHCQSTLRQVEGQLKELQKSQTTASRQDEELSSPSFSTNNQKDSRENTAVLVINATASVAENPVCRYILPHPIPTAMAIWSSQLSYIHKASNLPNDRKYVLSDFTAELLHLVSNRLPRAVKTVPHRWDSVERVLQVGYKRWKYLKEVSKAQRLPNAEDTNAPRKVNILIMGGSLLVGTNCRKIIPDFNLGITLPNRHCTWSNRLEKFLNQLLGPIVGHWDKGSKDYDSIWDLVHVTKTAMGGTNTQTGHVILEYDLLPEEARRPDIIINAYSTNDMHILTVLDAAQGNVSLRDKVFDMTQSFVRQVMQRRTPDCDKDDDEYDQGQGDGRRQSGRSRHAVPPLLLHMDDYLGNEQREVMATSELSQGVQVLANYYGFTSMSYADVVRDLVYGDTHESWFSPGGWYEQNEDDSKSNNRMVREIHPGMGMHITATWVTAFTMLHLATTYCSLEWSQVQNSSLAPWHNDSQPYYYDNLLGLPELDGRVVIPGKPRRPPRDLLPPPLTKELSLENVTELWRTPLLSSDNGVSWSPQSSSCDQGHSVRCPFSWVSSLNQQQKNVTFIREYFGERTVSNEGWNLVMDHNKLGYVPVGGRNSAMTLEFRDVSQPIRTITFFIMKSYGPRWANSRLQATVSQAQQTLLLHVLEGFHDKETSETYTEPLQLKHTVSIGSTFRLRIELIDGDTFKLMGLAVCS